MSLIKGENVPSYLVSRIEAIQQELEQMKRALSNQSGAKKRKIRLRGLWKGIKIDEGDIEEAKQAVFRNAYNIE